ncbi:hypothetical protein L208DRAFT_1278326, partial [Tricholoma matsutake]
PTKTNIIELFVSKSFFYSHYKHYFPKVAKHDEMISWLSEDEDQLCDVDLWGIKKEAYTFMDLVAWLQNGGTLEVERKEQEQEKEMGKGKGKGKGKRIHKKGKSDSKKSK